MSSKLQQLFAMCFIVMLFLAAYHFVVVKNTNKIGFVNSARLIQENKAMQEAIDIFEKKSNAIKQDVNEAQSAIRSDVQNASTVNNDNSSAGKAASEELHQRKLHLVNHVRKAEENMHRDHENAVSAVLDRINRVAKEYGEVNGYSYIIGTTSEGSILYGADAQDVTDEIIDLINRDYQDMLQ